MAKTKGKAGRKSKYDKNPKKYNALVFKYALAGLIEKEIAKKFGISEQTLNKWKNKYPKFQELLTEGKEVPDAKVEQALYHRALGYDTTDTKFATFEGEITDSQEYLKHFPPDVTACIFWLKNRKPKEWREKQEIDHTSGGEKITGFSVKLVEKDDVS